MFSKLLFFYYAVKLIGLTICFLGGFGICAASSSCTGGWQIAEVPVVSILICESILDIPRGLTYV
jgi:hypothetical protein